MRIPKTRATMVVELYWKSLDNVAVVANKLILHVTKNATLGAVHMSRAGPS